eukprot:6212995-Pleurochrysis_carterae.AAC.3
MAGELTEGLAKQCTVEHAQLKQTQEQIRRARACKGCARDHAHVFGSVRAWCVRACVRYVRACVRGRARGSVGAFACVRACVGERVVA